MITNSPKKLKWSAVSKRTRPVTQIAEVAVKSASQPLVHSPDSEATGSESRSAPNAIRRAKAAGTIQGRGRKLRRWMALTRTVSERRRVRRTTLSPGSLRPRRLMRAWPCLPAPAGLLAPAYACATLGAAVTQHPR